MKKIIFLGVFVLSIMPVTVFAQRGCCSWHGGVAGCDSQSGKQRCNDGTLSPSCTCSGGSSASTYHYVAPTPAPAPTPSYVYGCTDPNALNYNASANKDDGSCVAKKFGCMDSNAINYDAAANVEDNSCKYKKTERKTVKIKYKTVYRKSSDILKGKTKKYRKGKNGKKEITYDLIVDKDGKVLSRTKTTELVLKKPVSKIILKGTKKARKKFLGLF